MVLVGSAPVNPTIPQTSSIYYLYSSTTQYNSGSWTLLPDSYSTEASCRQVCNGNPDCVQFGFTSFQGIPSCYTGTTYSTLVTAIAPDVGFAIGQKIASPITP